MSAKRGWGGVPEWLSPECIRAAYFAHGETEAASLLSMAAPGQLRSLALALVASERLERDQLGAVVGRVRSSDAMTP
ncbi:hypothetical protein ACSMXN_18390 [Jatrophihabitans sp. DSM 45814]